MFGSSMTTRMCLVAQEKKVCPREKSYICNSDQANPIEELLKDWPITFGKRNNNCRSYIHDETHVLGMMRLSGAEPITSSQ
jgi:hypothetical protein